MKAIHVKRLRKLERHLRTGKLGHAEFDFGNFNVGHKCKPKGWKPPVKGCGTRGCAIGECPIVFPNEWYFSDTHKVPLTKTGDSHGFFGLKPEEYYHLFIPGCQEPNRYGGQELDGKATRTEVADNIRDFLKIKLRHRRTVKK